MPDQLLQFSLLTGLDGRTDRHTQQVGSLDQAINVVYDKTGAVRKRHGNAGQGNAVIPGQACTVTGQVGTPIGGATVPVNPYGFIARAGEQSVASGTRLYTYAPTLGAHVSKDDFPEAIGTRRPVVAAQGQVLTSPQNLTAVLNPDVAVSSDGYTCYVWQTAPTSGTLVSTIGFAIYDQAAGGGARGPFVYGNPGFFVTGLPAMALYNPKVIAVGTAFVLLFAANAGSSLVYAVTITHSVAGWISGPPIAVSTYGTLTIPVAFDVAVSGTNFLFCAATTSTVLVQLITPDLATNGTYTVVASSNLSGGGAGAGVDNLCIAVNGGNVWVFWHVASTQLYLAIVLNGSPMSTILAPTAVSFPGGGSLNSALLSYMAATRTASTSATYLVAQGSATAAFGSPLPYSVSNAGVATIVGGYSPQLFADQNLTAVSRPLLRSGKLYLMCWLSSTLQGTWYWVDLNVEATTSGNIRPHWGPRVVCTLANRLATGYTRDADTLVSVAQLASGIFITPIGVVLGGASRGAPGTIQLWEGRIDYTHPNRALSTALGRQSIAASSVYDGQLVTELGFLTYPESYTATPGAAALSGSGASITTKSGNTMTITGLTGITSALIGSSITISGAASGGNNGTFPITATPSGSSVKYTNSAGVASDANNPNIGWSIGLIPGSTYLYALIWEWTTSAGELVQSTTQASTTSQTLSVTLTNAQSSATINLNAFLSTSKFDGENNYSTPPTLGLYRSQAGGTSLTKVANIAPTTALTSGYPASFVDSLTDAQIAGNQALYFVPGAPGGILDNVSPPSFSHDIAALNLIWGIGDDLRTVWYSKPYVEGFQPGFNELLTTTIEDGGDLVALWTLNQNVIAFTATRIYLTYGSGPGATGTGTPYTFQPIQSDVGCTDPRSLVTFPDGALFLSPKGFCVLGQDMTVNYLGDPEEILASYPNLTSAVLVPEHHEVRIELNDGTHGVTLVMNYWSPNSPYEYKWSTFQKYDAGGAVSSCIATAAGYVRGYRWAASSGYVYTEDTTGATYMDGGSAAANWVTMTVQTGWLAVNGSAGYQRGKGWAVIGDWYTSHDITLQTSTDYDPSTQGPKGQSKTLPSSAFEGGPMTRARVGIVYQKHQAVQLTVTDAYPTGADKTVGTGRGFSLSSFGLRAMVKSGFKLYALSRSA